MPMTKEERSVLQETHDAALEMKAVLLGKGGVVDRLKTVEDNQRCFVSYKAFGFFFAGGGVLTAGVTLIGKALHWW